MDSYYALWARAIGEVGWDLGLLMGFEPLFCCHFDFWIIREIV